MDPLCFCFYMLWCARGIAILIVPLPLLQMGAFWHIMG
jgi:hypothetical protein